MFCVLFWSCFRISFSWVLNSLWSNTCFLNCVNIRITWMFTWMALALFKTLDSISTPCSVKALGKLLLPPLPIFEVANCDFKHLIQSIFDITICDVKLTKLLFKNTPAIFSSNLKSQFVTSSLICNKKPSHINVGGFENININYFKLLKLLQL